MSLADRRRGAEYLEGAHAVSKRRACQVVGIPRSTKRRPSGRIEEVALVSEIHRLSERYPRFGYRTIHHRLKTAGWRVGRERIRLLRRPEWGLRGAESAAKDSEAASPRNQHDGCPPGSASEPRVELRPRGGPDDGWEDTSLLDRDR